MLIPILIALLVVALGYLGYTVYSSKSKKDAASPAPSGPGRSSAKPAPKAAASIDDEDEATQVRVVGPRLVRVMGGLKVGDEIPLNSGVTIGRGMNCSLRLQDSELSNLHAEVRMEAGVPVIQDLGSTNGTFLNDQRLGAHQPAPIKDGDRIRVGTTHLLFSNPK